MGSSAPLSQIPVGETNHGVPAVAPDADFENRWAAWVARGRIHEQRARRTFVTWVAALAIGVAVVYAFLKS
jgi:hypothetical protein